MGNNHDVSRVDTFFLVLAMILPNLLDNRVDAILHLLHGFTIRTSVLNQPTILNRRTQTYPSVQILQPGFLAWISAGFKPS